MSGQENNYNITSIYTMPLARFILLVALVLLIINRHSLPAALLFFLLLTIELARLWSKFSLYRLETSRKVSPCRLFPGEETALTLEVHNNKWLPVFLRWNQPLIPELAGPDRTKNEEEYGPDLGRQCYLSWYDRYSRSCRVKAVRRGFFRLPPFTVETWDGLGMFKKEKTSDDQALLIVYPRLREIEELQLSAADLIGDRNDTRSLLFDPIRVAGLRDYTPDIPARFINWKASAHHDDLLVKVLEPTADRKMCVAVDVETFVHPEPDAEAFEEALSVAASLICWADGARIPFGLLVNGSLKEMSCPGVVPIGSSAGHINAAMETLARLELIVTGTLSELIRTQNPHLPWGVTLVIVGKGRTMEKTPVTRRTVYYHVGRGD